MLQQSCKLKNVDGSKSIVLIAIYKRTTLTAYQLNINDVFQKVSGFIFITYGFPFGKRPGNIRA